MLGVVAVAVAGLALLAAGNLTGGPQETALSSSSFVAQEIERRLYVSTVDGVLTALDAKGRTLWSYCLPDPLFSSTLSYAEASESVPQLIPGLDRALYHWDGSRLQRLPVMAEELIDQSMPYGEGSSLAGSKMREVVAVNLQSGKPVYECSQFKCHRYDNQSVISRMDILKVTTTKVTVREADEVTGEEMWNFTVGEVQLGLVEGEEEGEELSYLPDQPEWAVQVDTAGGRVYAVKSDVEGETTLVWEAKLAAPVTGVWLHSGGRVERVSVAPILDTQSTLMMVSYKHQFYIQAVEAQPHPFPGAIQGQPHPLPRTVPVDHRATHLRPESYLPVVPKGGTAERFDLALYHNDDSFLHLCTPGPSGLAVYFSLERALEGGYVDCTEENRSNQGTCPPTLPPQQPPASLRVRVGPWLVSLAKYSLFSVFVLGLNRLHRYQRKKRRVRTLSQFSEDDEFPLLERLLGENRESEGSRVSDEGGKGSRGSGDGVKMGKEENHSGSESTMAAWQVQRHDSTDSRFEMDYEMRGCLGRGGFGVVYHVSNRTDGGEYAVKRIKLPTTKSAREKVMREVQALAQLEHPGIVRYFHSWVERAPNGWNEREQWVPLSRSESYACADQSPFPSTSLPPPLPPQLPHEISPCPSFNSLNHSAIHSVLPPRIGPDSRSSSFVIEFQEDHSRLEEAGGCFRHDLLNDRDNLSTDSSGPSSTEDFSICREDDLPPAESPTYLFIQMQLCHKESLKEWLVKHTHNRERSTVMNFFEQMLDAVLYVHQKGMMHRDLKPSNIFFSLDGRVKVGDFGLVTGTSFASLQNSYLALQSLGNDPSHTGNIGTHFYMSPEQMMGAMYDQKVDIFALGVIFFELNYIFVTEMERVKVLEDLRHQQFPPKFHAKLPLEANFVEWLMTPLCTQRPSAEEVHSSDRFKKLRTTHSFTYIPKL